ncbi:hypothetical protein EXS78_04605 [Helicobacter pylori]|nr:hypothetical protein [Helicobacter pylori]
MPTKYLNELPIAPPKAAHKKTRFMHHPLKINGEYYNEVFLTFLNFSNLKPILNTLLRKAFGQYSFECLALVNKERSCCQC